MDFSLIRKVWAQPYTAPTDPLGGKWTKLGQILDTLLSLVFYIGIALTIIFLIIGGIRYITSGGSKEGAEAARSMVTNAVIGFIVVIGAFAIRAVVTNLLGGAIPAAPGWW